jgi:hypothetical protein
MKCEQHHFIQEFEIVCTISNRKEMHPQFWWKTWKSVVASSRWEDMIYLYFREMGYYVNLKGTVWEGADCICVVTQDRG